MPNKHERNPDRGLGRLVGTVYRGVTEAREFGTDDTTIAQFLELVALQIRRGVYSGATPEDWIPAPECRHPGAGGPCVARVSDGQCIWCERPLR